MLCGEQTKIEFEKLFNMYFQLNSKLDSVVYVIQSKFNLIKFAERLHKLSHLAPVYADSIQNFADLRGVVFHREQLLAENMEYESPLDCINDVFDYCLLIEKQLKVLIHTAIDNDDLMIEDFARDFSITIQAPFTHQFYKYVCALRNYDEENITSLFNSDFEAYNTI